jgi:uncharacterized membrane protein
LTAAGSPPPHRVSEDDEGLSYSQARVLALSDGVFAISLTLLVFSLRVPTGVTDAGLPDALRDLRPAIFAYALSVLVITAFWIGHHRSFSRIARVDGGLLWINVLYLGIVALIPFPTDMLGRYGGQMTSVVLYAAVISTAALSSWLVFVYARWRNLLGGGVGVGVGGANPGRYVAARILPICFAFLVSIPVAFIFSPTAAEICWLFAVPLRVIAVRASGRTP